jgi:hypothetical protein
MLPPPGNAERLLGLSTTGKGYIVIPSAEIIGLSL